MESLRRSLGWWYMETVCERWWREKMISCRVLELVHDGFEIGGEGILAGLKRELGR